jgi:hypothetical protein
MKRFLGAMLAAAFISGVAGPIRADEGDTKAILDKAMKALGGEEKLAKAKALSWKSKGTVSVNGEDNEITIQVTSQGLDQYRSEFQGTFGGNEVKGVTVLNGNKGWRKFGENDMEMDDDAIANEKRNIYIQAIPAMLIHVKEKGFKVESAGEEKVGDKQAACIKVTGPDGKDFKICFDKESGLPVRVVAKVIGFDGQEFTQETTYSNFKEFDGIKKATKASSKRDGEKFVDLEVTEFKILDKVEPDAFSQPK